jgi:hypothetical protein
VKEDKYGGSVRYSCMKMESNESVVRRGEGVIKEKAGGVNLRHVSFVNVTVYPWYNYNMLIKKKQCYTLKKEAYKLCGYFK